MIGQVVYQAMQRLFKLTNLSKKNVMKKLLNSLHSFFIPKNILVGFYITEILLKDYKNT